MRTEHPDGRVQKELDLALCRLIRLQQPEFIGGRGFQVEPLRKDDGGTVFLLFYADSTEPFDAVRGPDHIPADSRGIVPRGRIASDELS